MFVTLFARSKILQLTQHGKVFRVQVHGNVCAGAHVDLDPCSEQQSSDVTMWLEPKVIADLTSAGYLADQVLDYDSNNDEFIISNRGKS